MKQDGYKTLFRHSCASSRLAVSAAALFSFAVMGSGLAQSNVTCEEELTFTFWGSPQEKRAVEDMVVSFNESHPGIQVRSQHIPTGYVEKVSTMLASGDPPDVGYMNEELIMPYAAEGVLLDLDPYFAKDTEAQERLPNTNFTFSDGRIAASFTAAGTIVLYYNKALFEEAGVDFPPSTGADAWTWDEFVEVAKKLTKDGNGNDATSPDFDPDNIQTYGISFTPWWAVYLPLIVSNGGQFANDEGTELLINQPEAVDALQKLADLIYVHHVAPSPTQSAAFPAAEVMMQTGKVAMTMDGNWKVLDFSQLPSLEWSMGVLPAFKEPITPLFAGASVIFADTPCPDAAWEFYKFHNNPEFVDLFEKGLWSPLQVAYYTDPEVAATWLEGVEGVFPPEAKEVLTDSILKYAAVKAPNTYLKNAQQLFLEAIDPSLDRLWRGQATAQEAADEAVAKAQPLMEGRW